MVHIDFSELNQFTHRLETATGQLDNRARGAVRKTAFDIVATAQRFVPVDTGATKNSIYATFAGNAAYAQADIGPTTAYAPHLEYGTVRMAAHAFMGPALDRHAPDLARALGQIGTDL